MDFWGWFARARKETQSEEFNAVTDLPSEELEEVYDFFKVNTKDRIANFHAFLDMLTRG